MAYTDRRRETFAALADEMETRHRMASFERSTPRPTTVWLRMTDGGWPEVTRRVTGLRQYRLRRCRDAGGSLVGLKIWNVEDVVTGQTYDLPPMGNGSTVWIVNPNERN